ncbi:MAG: glycosyltransferase [Phascolarctobacterium sp.]|uniref:glycosyltransferase family 2 protein n=1 Tax=Phascolarctobacterium sp. TaxID=2049039 RepID=UPI0026DCD6E1|nr:glycosyltransferase [Phascolarctobacterium sp.]MDO4921928.1 glycosyltransferase [Phascolarctobacterium sp.]
MRRDLCTLGGVELASYLISVIVPIYNVEPYLRKCLDSILAQTYTNLEIICVDDGSTDASGRICDEYAGKDKRIKVIHQNNGGVSRARNIAMSIAVGKYIVFVDGDDMLKPNMVKLCLEKILEDNSDLVIGLVNDVYADNVTLKDVRGHISGELYKDYYNLLDLLLGPVSKLYKLDIIRKYNVEFPEDIIIAEDQIFNYFYLDRVKKYSLIRKPLYNYYHRNNGSLSYGLKMVHLENRIKKLEYEKDFLERNKIEYANAILNESALWYFQSAAIVEDQDNSYRLFKNRVGKIIPYIDTSVKSDNFRRSVLNNLLKYNFLVVAYAYFRLKKIFF